MLRSTLRYEQVLQVPGSGVTAQHSMARLGARFSDNEGDIIWLAWRAELGQRVAPEPGKIGNQITGGGVAALWLQHAQART